MNGIKKPIQINRIAPQRVYGSCKISQTASTNSDKQRENLEAAGVDGNGERAQRGRLFAPQLLPHIGSKARAYLLL